MLVIAAALITVGLLVFDGDKARPGFYIENPVATGNRQASYGKTFICNPCTGPAVHSATITTTADSRLVAAWFGGTREGARDVRIFRSVKTGKQSDWTPEQPILDRAASSWELGRYIKKLGNPVLGRDKDGRLWLFYVSVSAGGWSGSAINYQLSTDNADTWSPARRLVSSPFFNVSTLVRGAPVAHTDGSLSLPVYHELVGKFTELVRLGPEGKVLAKQRISSGRAAFQPSMAASSEQEAVMVMRYKGDPPRRIMLSRTSNAGQNWTAPVATSLPNPDAGISIVTGMDKDLLVVYNDSERDRSNLALAVSHDRGHSWKRIHFFEKEMAASGVEFSYPSIIRQGDQYHLVYTWKRKGIRYVTFNDAWVRKRERGR